MFVFTVCVYQKPTDDFSSGLRFYFILATCFDVCGPWPLRVMYFLLFPHTKMYTVKMIFLISLLDLLFIKMKLIRQLVLYLCESVSDQYCM